MNYRSYISSREWRAKHKQWLKAANYRCAMFPWVRVGQLPKGKYHRYAIHHMHYNSLGRERYWFDVLPLCPFAHDGILHGLLSGYRSASQQKRFPNFAQILVHAWMRIPGVLKEMSIVCLLATAAIAIALQFFSS